MNVPNVSPKRSLLTAYLGKKNEKYEFVTLLAGQKQIIERMEFYLFVYETILNLIPFSVSKSVHPGMI